MTDSLLVEGAGGRFVLNLPGDWHLEPSETDPQAWSGDTPDGDATLRVYLWNAGEGMRDDTPAAMMATAMSIEVEIGLADMNAETTLFHTENYWGVDSLWREQPDNGRHAQPWSNGSAVRIIRSGDLGPIQLRLVLIMDAGQHGTPRWNHLWARVKAAATALAEVIGGTGSAFTQDGQVQWRRTDIPLPGALGTSRIPLGWRAELKKGPLWRFAAPDRRWVLEIQSDATGEISAAAIESQILSFARTLDCVEAPIANADRDSAQILMHFRGAFERPDEHVWRWYAVLRLGGRFHVHRFTLSCDGSDAETAETKALVAFFTQQSDILCTWAEAA